ncbi:substrate-binding periplasmic protein [Oceanicoccus sagamiensis]|uniref:Uncharacterized protein n=1 Tax=Oceanicoccus sagamiensis TaxID=716816 RepID=A0A1X9NC66_9GAMM|nr:ABC transporter substrate-binding protein [Oceanicoccus sagamiensis]ARN74761.1 hypothetical protein BST96_11915 [Oceanicoccus sagamiensis]
MRYLSLVKPVAMLLAVLLTSIASAEPRSMRLGGVISDSTPPHSWVDPCTGQLDGSLHHLLREFFEQQRGIKLLYNPAKKERDLPWANLIGQLSDGAIDALIAVPALPKLPALAYSEHAVVFSDQAVVYLKTRPVDTSNTAKWREKRGLIATMGQEPSSNANYLLAKHNGLVFRETFSVDQSIDYLITGKGDYIITGYYRARGNLLRRKMANDFVFETFRNPSTDYHFAVKARSEWEDDVDAFSDYLKGHYDSGKIEYLNNNYLKKWLNSSGECEK